MPHSDSRLYHRLNQFHGEQGGRTSKPFEERWNEEPNMAYVATGDPELIFRIVKSVGAKRNYCAERPECHMCFGRRQAPFMPGRYQPRCHDDKPAQRIALCPGANMGILAVGNLGGPWMPGGFLPG